MKPVPADAVIVDLDGTLVDTLGDFEVALNAMLADLQLPCVEREDVRRWVGRGSEHLIACALTHTTGQPDGGLAAPGWLHYASAAAGALFVVALGTWLGRRAKPAGLAPIREIPLESPRDRNA